MWKTTRTTTSSLLYTTYTIIYKVENINSTEVHNGLNVKLIATINDILIYDYPWFFTGLSPKTKSKYGE